MNRQVEMKIEDSVLIAGGHAWLGHTRDSRLRACPGILRKKKQISFSGHERVPALIDAEKTISDSREIAKYLETDYPDMPSLKLDHGEVLFKKFWVETVLHTELLQLLVWTFTII